ncbi:hypothetical protein HPB49_026336 [Dermacentor silvarum]|nr:hypothetical protein HPB49_026336 [Dermacentor silvarum]
MALRRLDWIAAALDFIPPEMSGFRRHRSPRSISVGVPQGSVLSPFLFNLALARLPDFIPRTLPSDVRLAIYADDLALFAVGPTSSGTQVRRSIQGAINAIDSYLTGIGLNLSPNKPRPCSYTPNFAGATRFLGSICAVVRYLGVLIDHRLSWKPAVAALRKGSTKVGNAARSLLARGRGCSPQLALRIYNAVATSRCLYGLPLASLRPSQWETLDMQHRQVIRQLYGFPRNSPIGPTHAEAIDFPLSVRAQWRALNHDNTLFCDCTLSPTPAWDGEQQSFTPWLPPTPHRHRPPLIHTTIPGVRSKRNTPTCAILQEVAATFDERLFGRVKVFTDDSVLKKGSAAATCTIPELSTRKQCRIRGSCSSTLAELAALDLAADLVLEHLPPAVAILTDSRAALQTLIKGERGPLIGQRLSMNRLRCSASSLPKLGLSRADRAFLLRLRVGCAKTVQRVAQLSGTGSSVCLSCNDGSDETLSHILLECAGYIHARDSLTAAYRRLGLPSDNADRRHYIGGTLRCPRRMPPLRIVCLSAASSEMRRRPWLGGAYQRCAQRDLGAQLQPRAKNASALRSAGFLTRQCTLLES